MGLAAPAPPTATSPGAPGVLPTPPAIPRDGDASHPGWWWWQSWVSQRLRWLCAGTNWDVGRWRGGGNGPRPAPPHPSLPEVTCSWKEQRDNWEVGGGVGANPAANIVSKPVAFWECYSRCAAPTAAPPPARGVCSSCFVPPVPTLCCCGFCMKTTFLCMPGASDGRDGQQPCRVTPL